MSIRRSFPSCLTVAILFLEPGVAVAQSPISAPPLATSRATRCQASSGPTDPVVGRIDATMRLTSPDTALALFAAWEADLRADATAHPSDEGASYRLISLLAARANVAQGRTALEVADELHRLVTDLLEAHPDHAGAHHILGRLHAAGMRMGRMERFVARTLLGAGLLGHLSWDGARRHLEAAERLDPCTPDHHYELARLLAERGDPGAARVEIEHVLALVDVRGGGGAPGEGAEMIRKADRLRGALASR
jgi:hypothetical protein